MWKAPPGGSTGGRIRPLSGIRHDPLLPAWPERPLDPRPEDDRGRGRIDIRRKCFALCTQGAYGTIAEVDGKAGVLRLYQNWPGGGPRFSRRWCCHGPSPGRRGIRDRACPHPSVPTAGRWSTKRFSLSRRWRPAVLSGPLHSSAARCGQLARRHMWGAPGVMTVQRHPDQKVCLYHAVSADPILWIGAVHCGGFDLCDQGSALCPAHSRLWAAGSPSAGEGRPFSGQLLARLPMDLEPFRPSLSGPDRRQ